MLQSLLNDSEFLEIKKRCELFYGIENHVLSNYYFVKKKSALWIIERAVWDKQIECDGETLGLRVFSGEQAPYKPTFSFFNFFHRHITKGYFTLDDHEARNFIHRKDVELSTQGDLRGYYGVKNRGLFIGVGLAKGKILHSQVPKKISNQIAKT